MAGIETLAIDESSTFMNTASDSAMRADHQRACRATVAPGDGLENSCARSDQGSSGHSASAVDTHSASPLAFLLLLSAMMRAIKASASWPALSNTCGLVGRQAAPRRAIGQRGAAVVGDIDLDLHRQTDAQRMRFQFRRIERDAHRNALHDLDPVAAGILRRQQRKRRAGSGSQPQHLAVIGDVASRRCRSAASPAGRCACARPGLP